MYTLNNIHCDYYQAIEIVDMKALSAWLFQDVPPLKTLNSDEKDSIRTLCRIAANEDTPEIILAQLAYHPNSEVRTCIAENPATQDAELWALTYDDSADVRYALAENHQLDSQFLTELELDGNPYVAARAQKTLQRIRNAEKPAEVIQFCVGSRKADRTARRA
jgi:hypothetical protein